jgi:hypothetical protein
VLERTFATTKTHIDQHLRALAQRLTRLGQAFARRLSHQHLQRGNDRITGGGVVEANDMPGVLTTTSQLRSSSSAIT